MAKKKTAEDVRKEIEIRAYLIWEREGKPQGREREHWLLAEAEILGDKPQKKATPAKANGSKASSDGVAKTVVAAKAKRVAKPKGSKAAHRES